MSWVDLRLWRSRAAAGDLVARFGVALLDVYLEFLAVRSRPNTVVAVVYDLRVFFTAVGKPPAEVVAADVLAFVTAQHTGGPADRLQAVDAGAVGLSARTVRRRLSSVSGLFGFLQARGDVAANPVPRGLPTRRERQRPARYRGLSRLHAESDLRIYLRWCAERAVTPLTARRVDVELFVRWLQEVCRFKPSTLSRRLSVVVGFYRTCVIDAVLEHSPAEYVRRPSVPPESPTLGLSHLQFEAILTAARTSPNAHDFALVAMLGLLGLRIFEASGADNADLGEEHGHRVLRVVGKGGKAVLIPLAPAVGRAIDRAIGDRVAGPILLNSRGTRMDRHAPTRRLKRLAVAAGVRMPRMHPHMLRHTYVTTMLDAGVPLRDVQIAARHADPRTTMRYDRARKNLDRHPNYILAAFMASGT